MDLVTTVPTFVAFAVLNPIVLRRDYTAFRASRYATEPVAKDIVQTSIISWKLGHEFWKGVIHTLSLIYDFHVVKV